MAFLLARIILVPVSLSAVDIDGTNRLLHCIRVALSERGGVGPEALIVPHKLPRSLGIARPTFDVLNGIGKIVVSGLSLYPEHGRAFAEGRWIGDLLPGSRAHNEMIDLERSVAGKMRLSAPAPRLEVVRQERRERERTGVLAAIEPPRRRSRPWWQRLFAC